ncbi:MAG TPA: hypothetical protein VH107_04620 [Lacipirellulaceae bacterium]|jgi:hypothetical protein|nr:hypothetical protein [Lacipirellulaceae bacterium]
MMNYLRSIYIVTVCSSLLGMAQAQEPQPAKLYERGVNAYFNGRASEADTLLSEAIQWNSQDPRAYYFRAFSLLRESRIAEAQGDMLVGATLEAQSPGGQAVGSALERVQGCDRLMLEQFRRHARQNAVTQASATSEVPQPAAGAHARVPLSTPPQTFKAPDAGVLRERRIVPLEELLRPGGPQTVVEEPQPAEEQAQPKAPPAAANPAASPADNPFGDDTQKPKAAVEPPKAEAEPPKAEVEPPTTAAPKTPPQAAPAANPPAAPPSKSDENPFG